MSAATHSLELDINGQKVSEDAVAPTTTLLQYLRARGLTATKEGCAEGDCGACTVAVHEPGEASFRAVNSCLVLLPMVHNKHVVTAEALKSKAGPHPVQESLVLALGSQCGYCTPGVVMSMFEACYRSDLDAPWKLDDQMCGNLCRCTGYRPIREATREIAGARPDDRFRAMLDAGASAPNDVEYTFGELKYWAPASLGSLFRVLESEPDAKIVHGGTDLSLGITKKFELPPRLVSLEQLAELAQIEDLGDRWEIGAGVRLSDLETFSRGVLPPLERMLRFFGSRQIKHRAAVGGNLANASPIGDLPPVLLALGATIVLTSSRGEEELPLDRFFLAYRKTTLVPGQIISAVRVPKLPARGALASSYKVSKRQELDISTTAAAFFVTLEGDRVREARLAYGGMAATPTRAKNAERALTGARWDKDAVEAACAALGHDFEPIDDHRGSAWYRRELAANLLRGFFLETARTAYPTHTYRPVATVIPEVTP